MGQNSALKVYVKSLYEFKAENTNTFTFSLDLYLSDPIEKKLKLKKKIESKNEEYCPRFLKIIKFHDKLIITFD